MKETVQAHVPQWCHFQNRSNNFDILWSYKYRLQTFSPWGDLIHLSANTKTLVYKNVHVGTLDSVYCLVETLCRFPKSSGSDNLTVHIFQPKLQVRTSSLTKTEITLTWGSRAAVNLFSKVHKVFCGILWSYKCYIYSKSKWFSGWSNWYIGCKFTHTEELAPDRWEEKIRLLWGTFWWVAPRRTSQRSGQPNGQTAHRVASKLPSLHQQRPRHPSLSLGAATWHG